MKNKRLIRKLQLALLDLKVIRQPDGTHYINGNKVWLKIEEILGK